MIKKKKKNGETSNLSVKGTEPFKQLDDGVIAKVAS